MREDLRGQPDRGEALMSRCLLASDSSVNTDSPEGTDLTAITELSERRPNPTADRGVALPTVASVLAILAAIEGQPPGPPAAKAFRAALVRKGHEAVAAGGTEALADLIRSVAEVEPERANARAAALAEAWAALLPDPAGRTP